MIGTRKIDARCDQAFSAPFTTLPDVVKNAASTTTR